MAKHLTAVAIRTLKPGAVRREIRDGATAGLYLQVFPSGAKSWCLRFRRPDGRPSKLTLGSYDPSAETSDASILGTPLTLAGARALALQVHRMRAQNVDVIQARRTEKTQRRVSLQDGLTNNFAQAALAFAEDYGRRRRTSRDVVKMLGVVDGEILKGSLAARWGDRSVADISVDDLHMATEEARRSGIPGMGRRGGTSDHRQRHLHAALSSFFSWCHKCRRISANPCRDLHRPSPPQSRDRVLSDAEFVAFWRAASAEQHIGAMLKILLLSGQRLGEVAGMRRSELSDDGAMWHLPGHRTKNSRPHQVPLCRQVRELIANVPNPLGHDLVWSTTGKTPISGFSKVKIRMDRRMQLTTPWRLHDLRRTMATMVSENGIAPPWIVEALLNHVSGTRAGVAGTYNRALYSAEKKVALEKWSDHVEGITGENVITLQQSA